MWASKHPMEHARLLALRSYEVLDTDREKPFDDLVQLAAAICETPIGLITLVDEDRQWFKAETGLGIRETPLDQSICSHTILQQDLTEISDTRDDPRSADNPLVMADQGPRFYAGAPLITAEGVTIGSLCVLDRVPRRLTALQRDTLRVLAQQVMTQLELRKALQTAKMLRQEVDHRVKNSLQSLSSLTRIEGRHLVSPEAITVINNMTARLDAVSTLHELLYETDAGPTVNLAEYVMRICDYMSRIAPDAVRIVVDADPLLVSSSQAVSVGTLINELIANSFKHAFPDGRPGRITVAIRAPRAGSDGMARVTCHDDGAGSAAAVTPRSGGLGMKIAAVACMELECEMVVSDADPGIRTSFEFLPQKQRR